MLTETALTGVNKSVCGAL